MEVNTLLCSTEGWRQVEGKAGLRLTVAEALDQWQRKEDEVGTGCRLWGGGECDLTPVFAASLWPQAWRPGPCLWSHSLRREGAPGLLRAGWQRLPFFLQHVPVVITVVPVTVSLVAQASLSEVF